MKSRSRDRLTKRAPSIARPAAGGLLKPFLTLHKPFLTSRRTRFLAPCIAKQHREPVCAGLRPSLRVTRRRAQAAHGASTGLARGLCSVRKGLSKPPAAGRAIDGALFVSRSRLRLFMLLC